MLPIPLAVKTTSSPKDTHSSGVLRQQLFQSQRSACVLTPIWTVDSNIPYVTLVLNPTVIHTAVTVDVAETYVLL